MDDASPVRNAAPLAVQTASWLRDEEAACSTKAQQPRQADRALVTMIVTKTPRNEANVVRQVDTACCRRPRPA
jgi:hypothetical protein